MKRFILLFLICCLMITTSVTAFGSEASVESQPIQSEKELRISNPAEILEAIGIPPEKLTANSIKSNNVYTYEMDLGDGKTCEVTVETLESGVTKLVFLEDGVQNEIIYQTDGTVWLDGGKVTVGAEENLNPNTPVPYSYSSNYSRTPFKGKLSDYSLYVKDYIHNEVGLGGATLASIGSGALSTILTTVLKASLGVSLYVGFLTTVASTMIQYAKKQNVNFSYASYHMYKYARLDNKSYDQHYRYRGLYYAGKNCRNFITEDTYYEYKYFN